jgi:hypothetical protein
LSRPKPTRVVEPTEEEEQEQGEEQEEVKNTSFHTHFNFLFKISINATPWTAETVVKLINK